MNARRVFGAVVVAICLGAPLVEMFDQWDDTLKDGNDTEANLVIGVLCVGLALSAVGTVAALMRWLSSRFSARLPRAHRIAVLRILAAPPIPADSPPLALRI